jgi:3-hydroxyisobutyrate dehydrogenase
VHDGFQVGFIGIGNMGGPMASNLLQAGLQLLVYDRNPGALERLQQQGAIPVEHPRALAEAPGDPVG